MNRNITLLSFLVLLGHLSWAQENENLGFKRVELSNGYEISGTVTEITADSTIISVDGARLAYHNSVVKQIHDANKNTDSNKRRAKRSASVDSLELRIRYNSLNDLGFIGNPGHGGQLGLAVPFANNRLRFEFAVGVQYMDHTVRDSVWHSSLLEVVPGQYTAKMRLIPITLDLGLSFDFLAKSEKHGLQLYVGSSNLFAPIKTYHFNDTFSDDDDLITYKMANSAFPGVKARLEYSFRIAGGSSITLGYAFCYYGGSTLPETEPFVSPLERAIINGGTFATDTEQDISQIWVSSSNTIYNVTGGIGGMHNFSIGYTLGFGLGKKSKKRNSNDD